MFYIGPFHSIIMSVLSEIPETDMIWLQDMLSDISTMSMRSGNCYSHNDDCWKGYAVSTEECRRTSIVFTHACKRTSTVSPMAHENYNQQWVQWEKHILGKYMCSLHMPKMKTECRITQISLEELMLCICFMH